MRSVLAAARGILGRGRSLPPGVRPPLTARRFLLAQLAMSALAAALGGLFGGLDALVSAALGGAAVTVPNALFAYRLGPVAARAGGLSPVTFFAGEAAKIAATVLGLAAVARTYEALVWPALLVGMVFALKAYWLVLLMENTKNGR